MPPKKSISFLGITPWKGTFGIHLDLWKRWDVAIWYPENWKNFGSVGMIISLKEEDVK